MNNMQFPKMSILKQFFLVGFILTISTIVSAQGWEQIYDNATDLNSFSSGHLAPTPDSGYLLIGAEYTDSNDNIVVVKIDSEGVEQSRTVTLLPLSFGDETQCVDFIPLSDGTYGYVGYSENGSLGTHFLKFDVNGNLLLSTAIGVPPNGESYRMIESQDGNILILSAHGSGSSNWEHLVKIDLGGNVLWSKTRFVSAEMFDFIQMSNGNIVTTGKKESSPDAMSINVYNSNGDLIEDHLYDFIYEGAALQETSDGGLIIAANASNFNFDEFTRLFKLDANFEIEWTQSYEFGSDPYAGPFGFAKRIVVTNDGGYVVMGGYLEGFNSYISKIDATGQQLWFHQYRQGDAFATYLNDMDYLADDTYILSGLIAEWVNVTRRMYVVKLDSNGVLFTDNFTGQAFFDENDNCELDNNEEGLLGWKMQIEDEDGDQNFFITGPNFNIGLGEGNHFANLLPLNELWETCPDDFEVSATQVDNLNMDFGATPIVDCPYLSVHAGIVHPRRCEDNTNHVYYCNKGTIPATDAFIEIEVDPLFEITSATIPFTNVDNVYTFELGTIDVFECGSFQITTFLSCDSELGETVCIETHIFPDSLCLPASPDWSGASIVVDGFCENDSVSFIIQNVGNAATTDGLKYEIIVDEVILYQEPIDLNPTESINPVFLAAGSTIRLQADQEPNHPGFSMPSLSVEGCGDTFNEGFVEQFPQDDEDRFVDILCRRIIGSFDPNDKLPSPLGYGAEHFIEANQRIEYFVRFQNIGNAPAIDVVIRDTISPHLELSSIVPSVSSHDYTFQLEGRVAVFTFANIMLPDSTSNPTGSQGMIKYTINQSPNNPIGTVINNRAGIYFDNNPPIITNETWHTIGEDFIEIDLIVDVDGDGFTAEQDCDDGNGDINPDATEIPNNDVDEDCDGVAQIIDVDGDGFNSDEDCDDENPDINPQAEEIANNDIDEDCDGDMLVIDIDGDGFNSDEDCDDENPDINPGTEEIANNEIDEDCDGEVLIIDEDGDGFNSDEDCDDANENINPAAEEIANNDIDEDCDGEDLIIINVNDPVTSPFNIFPNPTSGILTIQHSVQGEGSIYLYDYNGKKLLSQNLQQVNYIDLTEFLNGVYLLEIRTLDGVWFERVVRVDF